MKKNIRFGIGLGICALLGALLYGGSAGPVSAGEQPVLKKLMADLLSDVQVLNQGMFFTDYKKVSEAAKRIAHHPPIRMEQRKKIKKELGPKMAEFKGFDMKVHGAALEISKAADKGDQDGIIKNYNLMITNCMQCHIQFRDRVIKVFK